MPSVNFYRTQIQFGCRLLCYINLRLHLQRLLPTGKSLPLPLNLSFSSFLNNPYNFLSVFPQPLLNEAFVNGRLF